MSKDPFRPAENSTPCPECGAELAWNTEDGLAGQMCSQCGHVFADFQHVKSNTTPKQDMEIAISWRTQRSLHHVQNCPSHQEMVAAAVKEAGSNPSELLICTVWN